VVDDSSQILLFRGGDPARPRAGTWWFTPGGAVEPGETEAVAARRELREETGLDIDYLGPIVLHRQVEHEFEGVQYSQEEDYFLRQWEQEQSQEKEELVCPICERRWLSPTASGTSPPHWLS
jgi:8-oxo-dGTP pyrophosphatase MutT (NUDIX family)